MVKIRLSRTGAKGRPFYHVVVCDERARRDGACLERVGFYNPIAAGQEVPLSLNLERIEHWLGHGAQMTDKVRALVRQYRRLQRAA
ncbi:MAG: 30S ribosomal protein S16 [Xanthomonadales bacterium]|nr:30S ribosomal protein S16 [Xanthomonadales bacterium]